MDANNLNVINNENEQPEVVLLEIKNSKKMISPGKPTTNWIGFHQQMTKLGWPDAENDNNLRALFNLTDLSYPNIIEQAGGVFGETKADKYASEESRKTFLTEFRNNLREDLLNKMSNDEAVGYDPSYDESVRFMQDEIKREDHVEYNVLGDNEVKNEEVKQNENEVKNENENEIREEKEIKNEENAEIAEEEQMDGYDINNNGANVKINPNQIIAGMKAEDYLKKLEEIGWTDARKDDVIRAIVNLAGMSTNLEEEQEEFDNQLKNMYMYLIADEYAETDLEANREMLISGMYRTLPKMKPEGDIQKSAVDFFFEAGYKTNDPLNTNLDNPIIVNPRKQINGKSVAEFLDNATENGWKDKWENNGEVVEEGAKTFHSLRAFCCLYNPDIKEFAEEAKIIESGEVPEKYESREAYSSAIIVKLVKYADKHPEIIKDDLARDAINRLKPIYVYLVQNNGIEEEDIDFKERMIREENQRQAEEKEDIEEKENAEEKEPEELAEDEINVGAAVKVDPNKQIGDFTVKQFLEAVEKAGWENASKDDVLRAFCEIYDPTVNGFDTVLNDALNAEYKNRELGLDGFRENIKLSLISITYRRPEMIKTDSQRVAIENLRATLEENTLKEMKEAQERIRAAEDEKAHENEEKNEDNIENNEENIENNEQEQELHQEEPQVVEEDPNLIPIVDPEHTVQGLNWKAFHEKVAANGWPNAEKDNTIRALFNLCDGKHQGLDEWAKMVVDRNDFNEDLANDWTDSFANSTYSDYIEPAKNKQNFEFKEEQRRSVLHFQNVLNTKLGYHDDFNAYYPAPEQPRQEANNEELNNEEVNNEVNNEQVNNENNNNNEELNNENNNELNNGNNNEIAGENNIQVNEQQVEQEQNVEQENENAGQEDELEDFQFRARMDEEYYPANRRPVLDELVIKRRVSMADSLLKDAVLSWNRGSSEFKNASEEFDKTQEKWTAQIYNKGDDNVRNISDLTEEQARELREELKNVLYLQDKYIGKKYKEKDKSDNAQKRVNAMKDAFDIVEEQIHALDEHIDKFTKQKAPSIKELANAAVQRVSEINGAKLTLRGSDEFDTASEEFDKIQERLDKLNKKYAGKEKEITQDELDELTEMVSKAQDAVLTYTSMKYGETVSENTHKRTLAMGKAATLLVQARRKFNQLSMAKQFKEVQDIETLSDKATTNGHLIQDAEDGVHFGSSEYKNAKNDYNEVIDHLKILAEEGHEITHREADDLDALMDKSLKSIDAYLATKRGKDLSDKTQRRVDAMRQAKENILEAKRRHEKIVSDFREKIPNNTPIERWSKDDEARIELNAAKNRVLDQNAMERKVWFGGSDYDKAAELYSQAVDHGYDRDKAREQNPPSKNSLEAELQELNEAKKAALVYINRKEKEIRELSEKGKTLDYKGQRRLEKMNKVYDRLNERIDLTSAKLEEMNAQEKKDIDKNMKDFVQEKKSAIPGKEGLAKISAMKAATAAENLQTLSGFKTLTEDDKVSIRRAAATLFLEKSINDKTFNAPIPGTMESFGKMVTRIMDSPEFKAALPDEKLDQKMCKRLLSDPNTLTKLGKAFHYNVQQSAERSKVKDMINEKNVQKVNQEEIGKNPLGK